MHRFIHRVCLLSFLSLVALVVTLGARTLLWTETIYRSYRLSKDVETVFLGNSHIGRSFVQTREYKNKLIYVNNSTFVAQLWRLAELERQHTLDSVKTIIALYDTSSLRVHKNIEHLDSLREAPVLYRNLSLLQNNYCKEGLYPVFWSWHPWHLDDCWYEHKYTTAASVVDERRFVNLTLAERSRMIKAIRQSKWSLDPVKALTYETLVKMKTICERHNVRLVLLATPLVSLHPHQIGRDGSDCLSDAIELAKRNNIEFYDCRKTMEDCYFADAHHLTKEGAGIFTAKFYSEILKRKIAQE